jgi:hypothetical protein
MRGRCQKEIVLKFCSVIAYLYCYMVPVLGVSKGSRNMFPLSGLQAAEHKFINLKNCENQVSVQ